MRSLEIISRPPYWDIQKWMKDIVSRYGNLASHSVLMLDHLLSSKHKNHLKLKFTVAVQAECISYLHRSNNKFDQWMLAAIPHIMP